LAQVAREGIGKEKYIALFEIGDAYFKGTELSLLYLT
jgi:hypothetical protein